MSNIVPHHSHQIGVDDILKLVERTEKALPVREHKVEIIVTEPDEYGQRIERRREIVDGVKIYAAQRVGNEELQQLLRPTTGPKTAKHLFRLIAHRPYARGEEMWSYVVSDLCKMLEGMSEGAIAKACAYFRGQAGQPFFPSTGDLRRCVEDIDRDLRLLASPPPPAPRKPLPQQKKTLPPRSSKSKYRVNLLCKLGLHPQVKLSKWQRLWLGHVMSKGWPRP